MVALNWSYMLREGMALFPVLLALEMKLLKMVYPALFKKICKVLGDEKK
jgi:hypothetical protein